MLTVWTISTYSHLNRRFLNNISMLHQVFVLLCISVCTGTLAQFYEDQRCRCVCPSQGSLLNKTLSKISDRKLYIAFVPPNKCTCDDVILPHVSDEIKKSAEIFCPRCDCRYESRNTTIIMVVVIIVLWALMLLSAYLIFLTLLGPLVMKKNCNKYTDLNIDEAQSLLMLGEDCED